MNAPLKYFLIIGSIMILVLGIYSISNSNDKTNDMVCSAYHKYNNYTTINESGETFYLIKFDEFNVFRISEDRFNENCLNK